MILEIYYTIFHLSFNHVSVVGNIQLWLLEKFKLQKNIAYKRITQNFYFRNGLKIFSKLELTYETQGLGFIYVFCMTYTDSVRLIN